MTEGKSQKMKTKNLLYLLLLGGIVVMGGLALGGFSFRVIDEEKIFTVDEINEIQVQLSTYPVHVIQTPAGNDIKFHLFGKSIQQVALAADLNGGTVVVRKSQPFKYDLPNDLVLER
jgi:lia operon protein LiaG